MAASHSAIAVREAKRVIDAATLSAEATAMEDEANRRLRGSPEQVDRFRHATRRLGMNTEMLELDGAQFRRPSLDGQLSLL